MTAKNLSEVLSAVLNEFNKANVATDLLSAQWNKVYSEHSKLNAFTPSKVRIVTANISLPVAFASLGKQQVRDEGLSEKDIFDALNTELPAAERKKVAAGILSELKKTKSDKLTNKRLTTRLQTATARFKKGFPTVPQLVNIERIKSLQEEFLKNPVTEGECKCYFKSDDLEKFTSDKIMRFDFAVNVSL